LSFDIHADWWEGGGGPSSQSGFPCSQVVGQPNASDAQEQTGYYACAYIGRGPGPLAGFQHLGGFPSETGKGGVSAEEADGDGHAPVWRDYHAIERELADQAEEKEA